LKVAARKASFIISVSKCTADDLLRHFNLSCSKIRVVYPGIDNIFNPTKDPSHCLNVRKLYGLPEKYILYVGNIEPKKNLWPLLFAQRKLRERGLFHKLVIVGKRAWGTKVELDEISREVKLNNVVWTGYVDRCNLPCIYQMADVFVFPSLYEGFGFPPLEAMACGTPVISTCAGALQEVLAGAALTVHPHNIGQMVRAVTSMITNVSLREKYIQRGLKQSSLFNWERTAQATLSVYREVFEKSGQRKKI
jgi:glycosyltransferase involved in cell wall biosynthesis